MSQKELSAAPIEQAADETAIDALVANAQQALAKFENLDHRTVDIIVETAAHKAREAHAVLAAEAVTETKRGNFEDKTVKNLEKMINHTDEIIQHMIIRKEMESSKQLYRLK